MNTNSTEQRWYDLPVEGAFQSLGSSPRGLTDEEARERLARFGPNELRRERGISPLAILLEQFKSILIIILLIAVIISVSLGEYLDGGVIFAIVLASAVLGFVQEYRAERAMEALQEMAAPTATVRRNGQETEITAKELVPGDIVLLKTGDRIPADLRLIEAVNLTVDEAPLTGESTPVEKVTRAIEGEELPVGDRANMAYMGTAANYGRGGGVVVSTGMATEFGKIASMLQEVGKEQTPLQINLDRVGKWLGGVALGITALVAALGVVRGHELLEMFIWGVSLAVAAVPEALPAVVTISLAIGVQRIARRHAIIRKLPAVETLGCTTVICSDKTGTLTQDEMTVRRLYVNGRVIEVSGVGYEPSGDFYVDGNPYGPHLDEHLQTLLQAATLCNDTRLTQTNEVWKITGDPTEGALVVVAAKAGLAKEELERRSPRVDEIPFSSETKRMTTVHVTPQGRHAYAKGAPEVILGSCTHVFQNGESVALDEKEREAILEMAGRMAGDALRVLAMAYKPLPPDAQGTEGIEEEMVFLGLAGMIDPPRKESKHSIELCEKAGIESVMITGDHKVTAMAVARELGLLKEGIALSGAELDQLNDEEFEKIVEKVEVYARVSPAHKMRVVEALQRKGHITAMTGDGVNDAPALKKADIGIAMGITGTDVSKEAADMVLTDDNFASIVAAVEEGRGIFDNIKKYLMFLLSCNAGEITIMLIAGLVGLPLPVVAIQLLWINLTTDGFPALALAIDPADPDIMERPPRSPREGVFTPGVLMSIAVIAVMMPATILPVFLWRARTVELIEAQTVAFTMITMFEIFRVFSCRSERHSIFKLGFFTNRWLVYAAIASVLMQMAVVYLPPLQSAFNTVALSPMDWALVLPLSLTGFVALELAKIVMSRLSRSQIRQAESSFPPTP
ncbi:MAG: ATPase [Chloroflexi bacterium RBG_13_54_9]|nr:MAG: ATPase [Chloroflexi bacterium RBG_13_54_9]